VEERTYEAFCFVVENRNSGIINNLVTRHILGGSYIIHDGWRVMIGFLTIIIIIGTHNKKMTKTTQAELKDYGES